MPPSVFDRHYTMRRNRRLRTAALALAGAGLLGAVVLGLDPLFSGAVLRLGPVLLCGLLFVVFLPLAIYFHLKVLSRE